MSELVSTCQYLGPDYDPQTWYKENPGQPTPYCGHPTLPGKNYCEEHYHVVYAKGTSLRKRHKDLRKVNQIQELQQLIYDIAEELEDECVAESMTLDKELV